MLKFFFPKVVRETAIKTDIQLTARPLKSFPLLRIKTFKRKQSSAVSNESGGSPNEMRTQDCG